MLRGTSILTAKHQTCEVKVDGAWRDVTLVEARTLYTMAPKRCPACHGQVTIAGNFTPTGGIQATAPPEPSWLSADAWGVLGVRPRCTRRRLAESRLVPANPVTGWQGVPCPHEGATRDRQARQGRCQYSVIERSTDLHSTAPE